MLLRIDSSVFELFLSGEGTPADLAAVNYLATAAMEGNHRITGERRTLLHLADIVKALPRSAAAYRRAHNQVSQDGNLHQQLKVYGIVVASDAHAPISTRLDGTRILTFPLRWFDDSQKILKCHLLGENLVDVDVYRIMASVASDNAAMKSIPLGVTPAHGGGSTVAKVLQSVVERNHLAICLADSDKASPGAELGQTAKCLQEFKDEAAFPICEVAVTNVRELENALPDTFYGLVFHSGDNSKMSTFLAQLTKHNELELRAHVDIKLGLKLKDVFELTLGKPERVFWEAKLPILHALTGQSQRLRDCLRSATCPYEKRADCTCELINGNRADILTHFSQRFGGQDGQRVKSVLGEKFSSEWETLGLLIVSWCCAERPLRV